MTTIYHNPRCSKSREALAILKTEKVNYQVVKYLEDSLSAENLKEIVALLKIEPIELVRINESIWKEHYKDSKLTDDELISLMVKHPKLIERPIVINGNKAVIGRPPHKILGIL